MVWMFVYFQSIVLNVCFEMQVNSEIIFKYNSKIKEHTLPLLFHPSYQEQVIGKVLNSVFQGLWLSVLRINSSGCQSLFGTLIMIVPSRCRPNFISSIRPICVD